ncbi:hypothetical protein CBL_08518 [Carabus blaptoides fortunei]
MATSSTDCSEATKKRKRTCKFNSEWLQCPEFIKWLKSVKEDDEMANCFICNLKFSIKWDALESVVTEITRRNSDLDHLPFSVSTDASNKGHRKMFPIAVRYFNITIEEKPIVDSLIDFREQWGETAEEIFALITSSLKNVGLDMNYMTSFGADNAPVNFGCKAYVFTKLRELNPKLIKANCNCHVLHNTVKYALKTMKFDVETLVLKIYSEFSSSTKNVKELKASFDFLEQPYYETLKHVSTRWISPHKAVDRLLKN